MANLGFSNSGIIKIEKGEIIRLKSLAKAAPLKRARLCLHKDESDPLQEMVIVLHRDSYIKPHRHKEKDESIHLISGSFYLFTFDALGRIAERVLMKQNGSGSYSLCRVRKNVWHTIVPLSKFVVFHELIRGPFRAAKAKELAPWIADKQLFKGRF